MVSVPADLSAPSLLDWAEASIIVENLGTISVAECRRRLVSYGSPDVAELELVFREADRRASIAPTLYPFEANRGLLRLTADKDPWPYTALLLMSLDETRFRRKRQWRVPNLVFDRLARDAVVALLGPGSIGIKFAFPATDGRPTNFTDAVDWLADRLDVGVGAGVKNPARKDGGVDVVAWRPFRDGRPKGPTALGQCTIDRDFRWKARDIVMNQWIHWIQFGWPPETFLAVPFAVPAGSTVWDDMHFTASFILDRMRLCELLEQTTISARDRTTLISWATRELQDLVA